MNDCPEKFLVALASCRAAHRLEVCATKAAGTEARLTNLFMFYD
jgi:hypothetical protein